MSIHWLQVLLPAVLILLSFHFILWKLYAAGLKKAKRDRIAFESKLFFYCIIGCVAQYLFLLSLNRISALIIETLPLLLGEEECEGIFCDAQPGVSAIPSLESVLFVGSYIVTLVFIVTGILALMTILTKKILSKYKKVSISRK